MSTTLTLSDLAVAHGARTLVSGLDLVLTDGDVTALVGANGSGKSSLMSTVLGDLPAHSGSVRLAPADASVGWLHQVPPDPHETLLSYARRRTGVAAADVGLHEAAEALAAGVAGADSTYATALERWLALGAADLDDRLPGAAARVGLAAASDRPLGSLSGGQVARAALVALLLSRYDVPLLDEPTNNLDDRGLGLVTEFARDHTGPVLVAGHDRTFLDEVATRVVELDLAQQRIGHYPGGWSDFVEARELVRRRARADYEGYAAQRDSLLTQAQRREEWASQGRRAVSRGDEPDKHLRERFSARADRQAGRAARTRRAADRLTPVAQPRKEWQLQYRLRAGPPPAPVVATLSAGVVERGGFRLGPVDLTLARGDRVAVAGDNGTGKSTLLAALFGQLPLISGRQSLGSRVVPGVLDQAREPFDTDEALLEVVAARLAGVERAEVRTLLAKFGLGSEHVARPARSLSLGERTRAHLALFQGRDANVLVLDEPTNHLDVAGIEQLERALGGYTGTLVVVSHDRSFLDALDLTRRWQLARGQVRVEELRAG